jgi:ribosomal protein S12 methylthiotransferase
MSKPAENLRVSLVSLGCPKNLVDTERMVGAFADADLTLCPHPEDAEVVLVNTCGFLKAAVDESVETIRDMVRLKESAGLRGVVVTGCLAEREAVDLRAEVPGVDAVVGFGDYDRLVSICREAAGEGDAGRAGADYRQDLLTRGDRVPLTPRGSAYLKISDGCNNPCSFCTIPSIRGRQSSRPRAELVCEARNLALAGTRELVIIGQDTTYYGFDTEKRFRLAGLLRDLADIPGIDWVRLLYAYPAYVNDELLDVLAGGDGVLPYMDIPLQHVSDRVLRRMRRPLGGPRTVELMHRIRERVPGIVLRTTFIVGAPGEGEAEFGELLDFVREFRFERLGVFPFSPEPDTELGRAEDQVPDEVKEERIRAVMELQQGIAFADAEARTGSEIDCLVEEPPDEHGTAAGRTWRDAPEIDGSIFIRGAPGPGALGPVRVTGADGYDLEGEWVS